MDTNSIIVSQLLEALNKSYEVSAVQPQTSVMPIVVSQVCTFLITAIGLILTYMKAASADSKGAANTESLGHITNLVNSKDTDKNNKIDALEKRIAALTGSNATLTEQAKATAVSEQVKTAVSQELNKP